MRVEQMRETLLARNAETYWVPETIRDGRFANWLKDARDWNISRSRYWGTPIPVWISEDGLETVCIGSIAELEQLSGVKAERNGEPDLHRETIDKITIPSKRPGHPPLKRIPEVVDCWFESGSMPYAQSHYPFENKREFEDAFPADFIAEGTDQTRGWFYTLLVLSTALFNKAPFKNLIVNGLVLASDGTKMSKRKKNYPDPMEVVNKYGADAVRLYLINSPVVKAETLKFKEDGVRDVLKDVFLPWFNAYRFLVQNIDNYNNGREDTFLWDSKLSYGKSCNVMDRWIISFTQSLLTFVNTEMESYRLYTVLPRLMKFIDNLTNWYVRTNRKRLKGEGVEEEDSKMAVETLFSVLYTMVRVFAPFTPFLTEQMYQVLKPLVNDEQSSKDSDSVHYVMIPQPRKDLIDDNIERAVSRMQAVIELGRVLRDRKTMPLKYPLPELVVIHQDKEYLEDVESLQSYVLDELNIKHLTLSSEKADYNVTLRAEPDHKTLGFRLKSAFKDVTKEIKALTDAQVTNFVKTGTINVLNYDLGPEDLRIMYNFGEKGTSSKYEAHSDNDVLVLLDCTPDQSMLDEGTAREVVNRIQKLRKKAGLQPQDEVTLYYQVNPKEHDLLRVINDHVNYIETSTKNPLVLETSGNLTQNKIAEEKCELKGTFENIHKLRVLLNYQFYIYVINLIGNK
jgi:isoleucyl-tRNA synthetase